MTGVNADESFFSFQHGKYTITVKGWQDTAIIPLVVQLAKVKFGCDRKGNGVFAVYLQPWIDEVQYDF